MMLEVIAAVLLALGGLFCFVAGIGIIRLGDIFMRMHASTKAGTLGVALIALAMMMLAENWMNVLEPLFVFLFMIATIPLGSHLIGRAAFRTHIPMQADTQADQGCEVFRTAGVPTPLSAKPGAAERA
jgi:multicomponent Na+:H+ antiporter subunit G